MNPGPATAKDAADQKQDGHSAESSKKPKTHRPRRPKQQPQHSENPEQGQPSKSNEHAKPHKPKSKRKPKKDKPVNANDDNSTATSAQQEPMPTDTANDAKTPRPKDKAQKPRQHRSLQPPKRDTQVNQESQASSTVSASSSTSNNEAKKKTKHRPHFTKNRPQGKLTDPDGSPGETPKEDNVDHGAKAGHKPKSRAGGKQRIAAEEHDLATTLAAGLKSSTYECMVCWDVIRPGHQTWSCDCCWAIFHLPCVQKWAKKSLEDTSSNRPVTGWRCPGCQHSRTVIPKEYLCFCGKEQKPETNRYLTPHSCGQLCKRNRKCPHQCSLPCHPGPCPPCTSMGPVLSCFCGEHSKQARCIDTDYTTRGYSCGAECGELLGCQKHCCKDKCHSGLCGACEVQETQKCYCGKNERQAACGTGTAVKNEDNVAGFYSCHQVCDRLFSCGKHRCTELCHAKRHDETCPFDPSRIKTCPCGAAAIPSDQRKTCTDPIPTCQMPCNKRLVCGHTCSATCHHGDCPPCNGTVEMACRCQSSMFTLPCSDVRDVYHGEPPLCDKVCRVMRSCGRHSCGIRCCPAMKQKGAKKSLPQDPVHECQETCGRTLSCGLHQCQDRCHRGPCAPCLEAIFDEVTCHCGNTRLQPPVRCGTTLPECNHPCIRPTTCGHVRILPHNCHPDSEPCPPCAMLVARHCVCGKTELRNIPCYRGTPHCGKVCEKPLSCGHRCTKTCHDGPCLGDNEACLQMCGKKRQCGHPCTSKCHDQQPCPIDVVCEAPIRILCPCGQNAMQVPCDATGDSEGPKRQLNCNDFCAKLERNRKLAAALEIDPEKATSLSTDELGYYDDSLCDFYMMYPGWCKQMETSLVEFVKSSNRVMHCKPAKSPFRKFIHRYCVHFNLSTEAVDQEPFRSVIVRKTLGQCRIPPILLSRAAHSPTLNRPPPATETVVGDSVSTRKKHAVNALCLSGISFGLLQCELDQELKRAFGDIQFTSQWLTDADAVIVAPIVDSKMSMEEKEDLVWRLKKDAKTAMETSGYATRVDCCWVDQHGKIVWAERVGGIGNSTSTQPAQDKPQASSSNKFTILSMQQDSDHEDDEGWVRVEKTAGSSRAVSENQTPALQGHSDTAEIMDSLLELSTSSTDLSE